jgi:hypothetical protein
MYGLSRDAIARSFAVTAMNSGRLARPRDDGEIRIPMEPETSRNVA